MKKIRYIEPAEDGIGVNTVTLTEQEAITRQKESVQKYKNLKPGFSYDDDAEALLDFIAVHWAWQVEE